jgi:Phasin protein
MPHSKQGKTMTQFPLSNPFGEIFAHNANLWFATHAELLANVDALTHAWLSRRREGIDAMREAIQQMTECQDPAEMLRIQQSWLAGAFNRASQDVAALNDGIASMTEKATVDFEKAARKATAPLHAVGGEMLKAAGDKPHKDRTAAE